MACERIYGLTPDANKDDVWMDAAECRYYLPDTDGTHVFFPEAVQSSGHRRKMRARLEKAQANGRVHGIALKTQERLQRLEERARMHCRECVVSDRCLEYALAYHIDEGIWGNTTADERRVILRDRRRAAG